MSKYHNDQPIQGGANDPDLLNRTDFANHLANILLLGSDDDCLTVSLEGGWGYGKTSVINLVKVALNEKKVEPIVVEYNPWLAGKPESLIQDFLLQFSSQLNIKNNSESALKAAKEVIAYSSLFSVAKLIPGAEPWASIIENVLSISGNATEKIAKLKKLDLVGKKEKVINAIKKINTPIVVIIDDIDRLTPSETFQILRLVKAVADFPGTSFLLAFDASYLDAVLSKNDIVNASEYINKVIQLRVPLPVISGRGMDELANVQLESLNYKNLTEQFESDQERLGWIYHTYFKHLINNLRELKRCFNNLRFVIEQVEREVCFSDLFSLSIIATKANPIYEHIKRSPEAYIGRRFLDDGLMNNEAKDVVKFFDEGRNELLSKFEESERKLIKKLIGDIFPLVDTGEQPFSSIVGAEADAAGRVSAPQRLHIALHYKTPIEYISDQEILQFISGDIDKKEFVNRVLSENTDERFFEMMRNYSAECKMNSFEILTTIYDVFLNSEKLITSLESNYGLMNLDLYKQMEWLTSEIIAKSENKYELIEKLIEREESAPLTGGVLYKSRDQIRKNMHGQWITKDQLTKLEQDFQRTAMKALTNKLFINNHLESRIFYELERCSKEQTSKYIAKVLNDDGVVRVAQIIGNSGSDSSNGPYVQIDDEKFSEVIDLKELRKKAREIDLESQPVNIQAILKSIIDGKKYYLRDGQLDERW